VHTNVNAGEKNGMVGVLVVIVTVILPFAEISQRTIGFVFKMKSLKYPNQTISKHFVKN